MPVHDTNRERAEVDEVAEVAPQPPEAAETTFTSEGDLPAVAKESGPAAATASELAFGAQPASGDTSFLDQGVHEPEAYKAACDRAGASQKWQDKYWNGHTAATQLTQPYEVREPMEWHLKKGESASAAVKAFLKGPTIADFRATAVAADLNELRDELGEPKFDKLFGSTNGDEDAAIAPEQRLTISAAMYTTPFIDRMKQIAEDHDAKTAPDEPAPPPAIEQREERPKQEAAVDQDPVVIAQELGIEQQNREIV